MLAVGTGGAVYLRWSEISPVTPGQGPAALNHTMQHERFVSHSRQMAEGAPLPDELLADRSELHEQLDGAGSSVRDASAHNPTPPPQPYLRPSPPQLRNSAELGPDDNRGIARGSSRQYRRELLLGGHGHVPIADFIEDLIPHVHLPHIHFPPTRTTQARSRLRLL